MTIQFKDLWRGHPINESVQAPCIAGAEFKNLEGRIISKGYPVFANQCAIRLGIALRRAGVTPEQLGRVTHCYHHPREEMHYINASQLAVAIERANIPGLKRAEKIKAEAVAEYYPTLFGRTGIVFIKDYWHRSSDATGSPTGDHIDVWNGYRSSAKWLMEWFFWVGYYANYADAGEIWFWEVE
ncbi:MAG: type VI secretion system amidase effector protein Tae4 [Pseudomonadota bacterium]